MVSDVFKDDTETLVKMTMVLEFEDDPRYMRVLHRQVDNSVAFKSTVLNILDDMEEAKKLPEYRKLMAVVYDSYLEGKDQDEIVDWEWIENDEAFQSSTSFGALKAFKKLPKKLRKKILLEMGSISKSLLQGNLPSALKKSAMNALQTISEKGQIIPEVIVWGQLSWQTYQTILRWYNGQISGKRCVKNIIDDVATLAGGMGGACIGGYIGSMFGPIGGALGALGGNILGAMTLNQISERLTRNIFDLPKSVALENCFNSMKLPYDSSNSDINSRYRSLARTYHPDKDPSQWAEEKWQELQVCMGIIKASKGDY